jgi:outer membrane lipoprotein-sorting protein
MRPTDNINDLIKKLRLKASTDLDKRVHDDISKALSESDKTKSAIIQPNMWSTIMKSPITKIAAAAVIITAGVIGLSLWRTTGSGIVLAEVLERIEQITAYTYQVHSTMTREQTTEESTNTLLISQEYGIKMTSKTADPNNGDIQGGETYLLPKKNSIIFINHKEKKYVPVKYDGGQLDFYKEEYNDPHTIIKQILGCDHISLGQSVVDGTTVEGFQTTDLTYEGGFLGQSDFIGEYQKVDVKLWVDVKTFLPIRLEEDVVTGKGMQTHEISSDFRWNIVINPADFEPNIPDDYTSPIGDVIVPVTNEENAVKGLRLYGDLVGKYPVSLDMKTMDGAYEEEVLKLIGYDDSYEGLSDDEKTRITSRRMLLDALLLFYEELLDNKKGPMYYGESVGPDDADKVLLRWKLDVGRYRIIFGDLSAKTAPADELTELEKLSSK